MTFLDALQQRVADLDDNAVPAAEAAKFLQDMEREHPYELFEWLRVEAERFVAAEFRRELRRKERRERREAERQARMLHGPFGKFADDFERPRPKPSPWPWLRYLVGRLLQVTGLVITLVAGTAFFGTSSTVAMLRMMLAGVLFFIPGWLLARKDPRST